MGGKTRVFGKNRVFSTKPGFPGRTSVLLANPGYFKGLEAQGIYIYIIYIIYISDILYKSQIKSVESGLNPSNENQLSGLAITKSDVQMCSNVTTHKKKTHN